MRKKENSKVIRVSSLVYEYIKSKARPMEDGVDSTLRRIFNLPPLQKETKNVRK